MHLVRLAKCMQVSEGVASCILASDRLSTLTVKCYFVVYRLVGRKHFMIKLVVCVCVHERASERERERNN